jgi:hypothetical protein
VVVAGQAQEYPGKTRAGRRGVSLDDFVVWHLRRYVARIDSEKEAFGTDHPNRRLLVVAEEDAEEEQPATGSMVMDWLGVSPRLSVTFIVNAKVPALARCWQRIDTLRADSVWRLYGWSIAPLAVEAGGCWVLSGLGHDLAGRGDRSQPRDPPGQRHGAPIVAGAAAESVQ